MKKTTNERLLTLLQSGRNRTTAQLATSLGIAQSSVSKRVLELRRAGYAIYTNTVKVKGQNTTAYRLGAASKQLIAAGFAALALAKTDSLVANALRAQNISLRTK